MRKSLVAVIAVAVVSGFLVGGVLAEQAPKAQKKAKKEHQYIGVKRCKICHKAEFASWQKTLHAKAFDVLKPEEQKKEDCVGCHTTGTTAKKVLLKGVQCEACHGPGSDYRKVKVMKDPKLAAENGLINPTKEACVKCHNKKSPTFKPVDFEKALKDPKAIHERKAAAKKGAGKKK